MYLQPAKKTDTTIIRPMNLWWLKINKKSSSQHSNNIFEYIIQISCGMATPSPSEAGLPRLLIEKWSGRVADFD